MGVKGSRARKRVVSPEKWARNHNYTFAKKGIIDVVIDGERWPLSVAGEQYVINLRILIEAHRRVGSSGWTNHEESRRCKQLAVLWKQMTEVDRELVEHVSFDESTDHPPKSTP